MAMNAAKKTMRPEVWVWLARERMGGLHPALPEVLQEGAALARRLGCALVALGDRAPDDAERAVLGRWGVAQVRVLGAPLPLHPALKPGALPLAPLLTGAPPRVLLLLADAFGRAVAPLLAAELGALCLTGLAGLAAASPGADGSAQQGAPLVAVRPTLGGQFETLAPLPMDTPVVATLEPGAVGAPSEPPRIPGHNGVAPALVVVGV